MLRLSFGALGYGNQANRGTSAKEHLLCRSGWVEPTPWLILTSTLATALALTLTLTPPSLTLTPTPTPTPTKVGLAAQPKPSLPCSFLF